MRPEASIPEDLVVALGEVGVGDAGVGMDGGEVDGEGPAALEELSVILHEIPPRARGPVVGSLGAAADRSACWGQRTRCPQRTESLNSLDSPSGLLGAGCLGSGGRTVSWDRVTLLVLASFGCVTLLLTQISEVLSKVPPIIRAWRRVQDELRRGGHDRSATERPALEESAEEREATARPDED